MNIFNLSFNSLLNTKFIINLVLTIIFVEISLIFFQKIFKIQMSRKNNLIYILINILNFTLGNLLGNSLCASCFMLIGSFIFMIYGIKISNLKVLSYFSLLSILSLNLQFFIFKILNGLSFCNSYSEMIKLPISNIILMSILSIFGALIYLYFKEIKLNSFLVHAFTENAPLIVGISSLNLLTVYTVSGFLFEILCQNIFYILTLDFYFYFSLNIIMYFCYLSYNRQKINNLKLCNKTILALCDETRAFKHDFHNIIQAIGGYVITKDLEGLKKYYKQISKDCIISNNLSALSPDLINNPAIYNILADKYHVANNHSIEVNLDVMLDLNNLNMNIYELTRILGILLDNAIEASKECNEEKNINISFKQDKQKQMIIIENTYTNKQIAIDKIFEKDYSTKPHNTGLGLWEVKQILKKNANLNLHTTKNNDYFSQQLEIYSA